LAIFYTKRIRRILPTLYLMVLCVSVISWFGGFWLTRREISESSLAALLSISNLLFLSKGASYFSTGPEFNPLLHTWSLAVEEQIYLVYPVVLLGLLRAVPSKRGLQAVLSLLAIISFALQIFLSWGPQQFSGLEAQSIAFYLPMTRAWEFLIGAILAFVLANPVLRVRQDRLLVGFSVSLLVLVAFLIDSQTFFPGWVAIVPVFATASLILLGNNSNSLLHFVLGDYSTWGKILGWLGDRSYSWYLWHWLLLLWARQSDLKQSNRFIDICVVLLALIPAHLSFKFVEQRWRGGVPLLNSRRLTGICLCVSVIIIAASGSTSLLSERTLRVEQAAEDRWTVGDCRATEEDCIDSAAFVEPTIFLVGDSHAGALAQAVREIADRLEMSLVITARSGCPFVNADWGFFLSHDFSESYRTTNIYCRDQYARVLELVANSKSATVLIADYSALFDGGTTLYPRFDSRVVCPIDSKGDCLEPNTLDSRRRCFREAYKASVAELLARGADVLLIGAAPVMFRESEQMSIFEEERGAPLHTSLAMTQDSDELKRGLSKLEVSNRVTFLDLHQILCGSDLCAFSSRGSILCTPAPAANDHLSIRGAALLVTPIMQFFD